MRLHDENENLGARALIGRDVPSADGSDEGARVFGYDSNTEEYLVQEISWSTGDPLGPVGRIDSFKASYQYMLNKSREALVIARRLR